MSDQLRAAEKEKRREFARQVFRDFSDKIPLPIQEKILAQQVVTGMTPYEAYLAGGAFAFAVEADQSKWPKGSDPYKVMWAQSTRPDRSRIWMTFETDTQYPGEGVIAFKVFFQRGLAIEIKPVGHGAVTPLGAKIPVAAPQSPSTPAPEASGNSRDMFSWIEGITQEEKNHCLSSAYRVPSDSKSMPGQTMVRLPSAGLWCFFDASGRFYNVRLEAPFSGSVSGIRIGDGADRLEALGNPFTRHSIPRDTLPKVREDLFYNLGDAAVLHAHLDGDGIIRTMWVVSRNNIAGNPGR